MTSNNWKLSPSDFAFLWEECKRCFYLKVARNFYRPRAPFPRVFGVIDRLINSHFNGKPSNQISNALPEGFIKYGESWVQSEPIHIPGRSSTCYIRGRFDSVLEFTDGGYGIIDFKTTSTSSEHIELYSRQLHSYAFALERPAHGYLALNPITRLGLVCVEPTRLFRDNAGVLFYGGEVEWKEMERNDLAFEQFLGEVIDVLDQDQPPSKTKACGFCKYRESGRQTGL